MGTTANTTYDHQCNGCGLKETVARATDSGWVVGQFEQASPGVQWQATFCATCFSQYRAEWFPEWRKKKESTRAC